MRKINNREDKARNEVHQNQMNCGYDYLRVLIIPPPTLQASYLYRTHSNFFPYLSTMITCNFEETISLYLLFNSTSKSHPSSFSLYSHIIKNSEESISLTDHSSRILVCSNILSYSSSSQITRNIFLFDPQPKLCI